MKNLKHTKTSIIAVEQYTWLFGFLWLVLIVASMIWNMMQIRNSILEMARVQARGAFQRDIVYRLWNANNNGVYVPVSETTKPNPYLEFLSERDISTKSGRKLTLMNPAYMTRQVYELAKKEFGIRSHITSLKPIRPENRADQWETEALKNFERGELEVSSIQEIDDAKYMRLMQPLITNTTCLKCHAVQGYKAGDIRGGISISIPMDPLKSIARLQVFRIAMVHILLWLFGVAGILLTMGRLKRSERARDQIEEALKVSADEKKILLREAHHRVKNNFMLISSLLSMHSRRIKDPSHKQIFQQSQNNINMMAKLHEILYQTKTIGKVNMKIYIREIIDSLKISYKIDTKRIKIHTNIDKIELDSKRATNCGLIVTELFTNAYKYGIPEGKEGEIRVDFVKQIENEKINMTVHNSGIALPEDIDIKNSKSMGLQLVSLLTDQLEGTMTVSRQNGTTFIIIF